MFMTGRASRWTTPRIILNPRLPGLFTEASSLCSRSTTCCTSSELTPVFYPLHWPFLSALIIAELSLPQAAGFARHAVAVDNKLRPRVELLLLSRLERTNIQARDGIVSVHNGGGLIAVMREFCALIFPRVCVFSFADVRPAICCTTLTLPASCALFTVCS